MGLGSIRRKSYREKRPRMELVLKFQDKLNPLELIELAVHQLLYAKRVFPVDHFMKAVWRGLRCWVCRRAEDMKRIKEFLELVEEFYIRNETVMEMEFVLKKYGLTFEDYTFQVHELEPRREIQERLTEIIAHILMTPPNENADSEQFEIVLEYDMILSIHPPVIVPASSDFNWSLSIKGKSVAEEKIKEDNLLYQMKVYEHGKIKNDLNVIRLIKLPGEEGVKVVRKTDYKGRRLPNEKLEEIEESNKKSIVQLTRIPGSGDMVMELDDKSIEQNYHLFYHGEDTKGENDNKEDMKNRRVKEFEGKKCRAKEGKASEVETVMKSRTQADVRLLNIKKNMKRFWKLRYQKNFRKFNTKRACINPKLISKKVEEPLIVDEPQENLKYSPKSMEKGDSFILKKIDWSAIVQKRETEEPLEAEESETDELWEDEESETDEPYEVVKSETEEPYKVEESEVEELLEDEESETEELLEDEESETEELLEDEECETEELLEDEESETEELLEDEESYIEEQYVVEENEAEGLLEDEESEIEEPSEDEESETEDEESETEDEESETEERVGERDAVDSLNFERRERQANELELENTNKEFSKLQITSGRINPRYFLNM